MLVKEKNWKIKCPYPMEPEFITVHNTYNDASAENEIQYMINNHNQVSFQYAVDDKEVVQGVLESRNAWAAGDGGQGPGNRKSIHVEICYSKSGGERYKKAESLAIKFIAQKLKEKNWGIDRVKSHQDWSGKKCPHRILDEGRWISFLNAIEKEMEEEDMLEKAIVVNSFADFPNAEMLANRLGAPIYTRPVAEGKKVAKKIYICGGSSDKLQADKFVVLSGVDRYDTAAKINAYLKG
jgi:hypothetical protein